MNLTVYAPLNIQPVDVVRGLKRQYAAASTNFVGCFLLALSYFFFSLLLSALNDLIGPSAGPSAQITYSIPLTVYRFIYRLKVGGASGRQATCQFQVHTFRRPEI